MGADCKSVVDDFGGSNPPSPTTVQVDAHQKSSPELAGFFDSPAFFMKMRSYISIIYAEWKRTPGPAAAPRLWRTCPSDSGLQPAGRGLDAVDNQADGQADRKGDCVQETLGMADLLAADNL